MCIYFVHAKQRRTWVFVDFYWFTIYFKLKSFCSWTLRYRIDWGCQRAYLSFSSMCHSAAAQRNKTNKVATIRTDHFNIQFPITMKLICLLVRTNIFHKKTHSLRLLLHFILFTTIIYYTKNLRCAFVCTQNLMCFFCLPQIR